MSSLPTIRAARTNIRRKKYYVGVSDMPRTPRNQELRGLQSEVGKKRFELVERASLCTNCLGRGHSHTQCSAGSCRICRQRHHTYLHQEQTHFSSRHRTLHIVPAAQPNIRGNLPRHLQVIGNILLNTNLGYRKPNPPDQIQHPILND
jgi:hypothetical protein